jgi:hypothetical protein
LVGNLKRKTLLNPCLLDLVDEIKKCADSNGLPIIPHDKWNDMNNNYSKQDIKDALAYYIVTEKPKFPFREIEESEAAKKFHRLCKEDYNKFYIPRSLLHTRDVLEKYDDYKYPFSVYGNGLIQFGHYYNDISNIFQQENRYSCGSYGFAAPLEIWKDEQLLRKMNYTFWRLGNKSVGLHNWRGSFRLGAYVATQFKPHVAKTIYDLTKAKSVMDTSCGWGDRLAAFYASNAYEYYGCDPNEKVFETYKKQCVWYEKQLGCNEPYIKEEEDYFFCWGKKYVVIHRKPAEDIDWNTRSNPIDCLFTSPPYFSTELYNKGGENEKDQSWARYNEYSNWRDGFLFPMLTNAWKVINDGGYVMINIMDPVIGGIRYRTCDEMVDFMCNQLGANFIGQIGMRIKQRPKKTNDLSAFLEKDFIENIWCFGKGVDKLPTNGTLENYME